MSDSPNQMTPVYRRNLQGGLYLVDPDKFDKFLPGDILVLPAPSLDLIHRLGHWWRGTQPDTVKGAVVVDILGDGTLILADRDVLELAQEIKSNGQ
jgi:hypothetical protein